MNIKKSDVSRILDQGTLPRARHGAVSLPFIPKRLLTFAPPHAPHSHGWQGCRLGVHR